MPCRRHEQRYQFKSFHEDKLIKFMSSCGFNEMINYYICITKNSRKIDLTVTKNKNHKRSTYIEGLKLETICL